jgi:hypothetical protein
MFVPFANSYGALTGLVVSVAVNLWISIGSILHGQKPVSKPFRIDMCASNATNEALARFAKHQLEIAPKNQTLNFEYGIFHKS